MPTESRNGSLLANRYQLLELIGSGAMGKVYRAEDKLLGGVTVAVKFLSQTLLSNRMKERFEREATISALLGEKSSHIVRVRDYGVDEKEIPFYVMEYLNGQSLGEIIKFRPLSLNRFLRLLRQICFGLECAHKGIIFQGELCPIVHRDLKPSNIFVIQDSALGELVKILDFGVAKLVQSGESQTQSFMGTLAYCSPEQMEGKELDSRSDIYSLGILMYEILTGELPLLPENTSFGGWYEAHHYSAPRPFNAVLKIPAAIENLILKCLAKEPGARPQSIGELLAVLDAIDSMFGEPPDRQSSSKASLPISRLSRPEKGLPTARKLLQQSVWPGDKPQQKIVFPKVFHTSEGDLASLWVMLEQEDIRNRLSGIRYNQFLFMTSPHPMVLWITVLYDRDLGPRWLPCYLDLKTSTGQRLARLLGEVGSYWILFFALEDPSRCQQAIPTNIASEQRGTLQEWADTSQVMPGGKPQLTKKLLKAELEKLKPKITYKLKGLSNNRPNPISNGAKF